MSKIAVTYNGVTAELEMGGENQAIRHIVEVTGNRFFEYPMLDWIKRHFPIQKRILDIGASYGNHSMFFSLFLEHEEIVAFEPQPDIYQHLLENMAGRDRFVAHNIALGDKPCRGVMYNIEPDNNAAARVAEKADGDVEIKTVDSFGFADVTLMKLDVEGAEPSVLRGAIETIDRYKPLIICEGWTVGHVRRQMDVLRRFGYSCKCMGDIIDDLSDSWAFIQDGLI